MITPRRSTPPLLLSIAALALAAPACSGGGKDSESTAAGPTGGPGTPGSSGSAGTVSSSGGGDTGASATGQATGGATTSTTSATNTTTMTTAGTTSSTSDTDEPVGTPTVENLRVAFIGDQTTGQAARDVLDLVKAEGAEFLIIAGDFDYNDDPTAWDDHNVGRLGADYPVFAVAGNHDESAFYGDDGYQAKIQERTQNAIDDGATCTGELGLNSACSYKGLFMVFSGVDVYNSQGESEDYIAGELANDDAIWSVCAWHKNQNDMQAGGKGDEAGWGVYQACQDGAAIVVTGHEHSYARTLTLTNLGDEGDGHGAMGEHGVMMVGEGSTFVTVSGIGGQALRDYHADEHDDDTWWSTIYAVDYYLKHGDPQPVNNPAQGALFIDFHVDGDPYKAFGYFKNINGEVIDEFEIVRDPEMSPGGTTTEGGDDPDLVIETFDDAYVDGDAPGANFGASEDLLIDAGPSVYETFIKPAGLDAIPPGTQIAEARLVIVAHDEGDTVEVHRADADWSEGAITFDNRPGGAGVELTFAASVGTHELDVTSVVQGWVDGQPNYGLVLRSEGTNGSDFYSSEAGFGGPALEVWYAP